MSEPTQPKPKLDLVVLDCPDAMALAEFYGKVLGWTLEDSSHRDFATLVPPDGGINPDNPDGHTALGFQRINDWVEPTWPSGSHPQQVHLDLSVPDIAEAEPAVVAAGARGHEHQPATGGGLRG